jgi:hypothetical protein
MIVLWTKFLSKLRIDLSFLDCGEGQTPSNPGIIYAFLNSEKNGLKQCCKKIIRPANFLREN